MSSIAEQIIDDLTDGITGTLQKDREEALIAEVIEWRLLAIKATERAHLAEAALAAVSPCPQEIASE